MAYTSGTTGVKESCFALYVTTASATTSTPTANTTGAWTFGTDTDTKWCLLGKVEEGASFTTEDGNTIMTSDCDDLKLAKLNKVTFNDINVTADNYAQLKAMDSPTADKCSFLLYDTSGIDWIIQDVKPSVNVNVVAGDVTKCTVTATRKTAAGSFAVNPFTGTLA